MSKPRYYLAFFYLTITIGLFCWGTLLRDQVLEAALGGGNSPFRSVIVANIAIFIGFGLYAIYIYFRSSAQIKPKRMLSAILLSCLLVLNAPLILHIVFIQISRPYEASAEATIIEHGQLSRVITYSFCFGRSSRPFLGNEAELIVFADLNFPDSVRKALEVQMSKYVFAVAATNTWTMAYTGMSRVWPEKLPGALPVTKTMTEERYSGSYYLDYKQDAESLNAGYNTIRDLLSTQKIVLGFYESYSGSVNPYRDGTPSGGYASLSIPLDIIEKMQSYLLDHSLPAEKYCTLPLFPA